MKGLQPGLTPGHRGCSREQGPSPAPPGRTERNAGSDLSPSSPMFLSSSQTPSGVCSLPPKAGQLLALPPHIPWQGAEEATTSKDARQTSGSARGRSASRAARLGTGPRRVEPAATASATSLCHVLCPVHGAQQGEGLQPRRPLWAGSALSSHPSPHPFHPPPDKIRDAAGEDSAGEDSPRAGRGACGRGGKWGGKWGGAVNRAEPQSTVERGQSSSHQVLLRGSGTGCTGFLQPTCLSRTWTEAATMGQKVTTPQSTTGAVRRPMLQGDGAGRAVDMRKTEGGRSTAGKHLGAILTPTGLTQTEQSRATQPAASRSGARATTRPQRLATALVQGHCGPGRSPVLPRYSSLLCRGLRVPPDQTTQPARRR